MVEERISPECLSLFRSGKTGLPSSVTAAPTGSGSEKASRMVNVHAARTRLPCLPDPAAAGPLSPLCSGLSPCSGLVTLI